MWITCFTSQKVKFYISWTFLHAIWSHSENVNIMYLFINFMQQKKLIRCSTNHSTVLLYRPYSLKKNCQCYQYHIIIVINIMTIINIIFIIITIIINIVLLFLSASLFANGILSFQLRFNWIHLKFGISVTHNVMCVTRFYCLIFLANV